MMELCALQFDIVPQGEYFGEQQPVIAPDALPVLSALYTVELAVYPPGCEQPVTREAGQFDGWNFVSKEQDVVFRGMLEKVHMNSCNDRDLAQVGSELWDRLVKPGSKIAALFKQTTNASNTLFHIRLKLPSELHNLPWEAAHLRDEETFVALESKYIIVRETEVPAETWSQHEPPIKVLLVAPGGLDINVKTEETQLRQLVKKHELSNSSVMIESLGNSVSLETLRDALRRQPWDIVHYIGHGGSAEDGTPAIALNEPGTLNVQLVSHGQFAQMFRDARIGLVVLNCCRGTLNPHGRKFGGLGGLLRRQKVSSVVAMRYDIPDDSALVFSRAFYDSLFGEKHRGRVDLAINAACDALVTRETRAPFTPALFMARGAEQLFTLVPENPADRPKPPKTSLATRRENSEQLKRLLAAMERGHCIVLGGPKILHADAVRDTLPNQPLGLFKVAQQLAQHRDCPYPHDEDIDWCANRGDAGATQLLQWVSQHYFSSRCGGLLVSELQRAYADCAAPPAVCRLARWRVGALFYTSFDGLLEQQVDLHSDFRTTVIPGILSRNDPDSELQERLSSWYAENLPWLNSARGTSKLPASRLLVLVRGSLRKPGSLRVSEDHHDQLWDDITTMSAKLSTLISDVANRSLCLIGADPSELLIHRLARKLVLGNLNRTFGPTFIVGAQPTRRDQNYWEPFNPVWVPESLDEVIQSVTDLWP